jgi:hypothetical protein
MTISRPFDRRALWFIVPGVLLLLLAALTVPARGTPPDEVAAAVAAPDAGPQPDGGTPEPDNGLGSSPSIYEVMAAVGALWTLVSMVVAMTPTQRDDEALSRVRAFFDRISFLLPKNVPSGPLWRLSMPGLRKPPGGLS